MNFNVCLLPNQMQTRNVSHLNDSVDVLTAIKAHEVHGKNFKVLGPIVVLLDVLLQVQPAE